MPTREAAKRFAARRNGRKVRCTKPRACRTGDFGDVELQVVDPLPEWLQFRNFASGAKDVSCSRAARPSAPM